MSKLTEQLERRIKSAIENNDIPVLGTVTKKEVEDSIAQLNAATRVNQDFSDKVHEAGMKKSKRGGKRPGAGRKPYGKTALPSKTLGYHVREEMADEIDAAIRQLLKKRFKITVKAYKKKDVHKVHYKNVGDGVQ